MVGLEGEKFSVLDSSGLKVAGLMSGERAIQHGLQGACLVRLLRRIPLHALRHRCDLSRRTPIRHQTVTGGR